MICVEADLSKLELGRPSEVSAAASWIMCITSREEGQIASVCLSLRKLELKASLPDLQATKDVLAMASLEVDLNKIEPGQTITVKWRGKPVFIKRRTEEDIEYARDVDLSSLRDPQTDEERTQKPEWLVLVGVCTHLGERFAGLLLGFLGNLTGVIKGIDWPTLAPTGLWRIVR